MGPELIAWICIYRRTALRRISNFERGDHRAPETVPLTISINLTKPTTLFILFQSCTKNLPSLYDTGVTNALIASEGVAREMEVNV